MSYITSPIHNAVGNLADVLIKMHSRSDGNYDCSKCGKFIHKFGVSWSIDEKTGKCSGPLCGNCLPNPQDHPGPSGPRVHPVVGPLSDTEK